MYVDFGRRRGRVRFTWKELLAVGSLIGGGLGYMLRNEFALAKLRGDLAACQESVKQVSQPPHAHGRDTTTRKGEMRGE